MFIYCKTARFSPKKRENPLLFARPSAVFRKTVPGRIFASPVRIASSARFVYNSKRIKRPGDDFTVPYRLHMRETVHIPRDVRSSD